jgi:DNA-binding transcriptional ArsR family regulator
MPQRAQRHQKRLRPILLDKKPRVNILIHMVKYSRSLDATFKALADPTRRGILAELTRGQASVTQLAGPYRMSLPAVMKHLRVLEQAGLVTQRKTGRVRRCRLSAQPLEDAASWLSQYRAFWGRQFDALDRYLVEEKSLEENVWPKHNKARRKQRSK